MSRNLLRKTKRENVQTLLYQTLNFVRVVVDTDPYTDTEAISLSSLLLLARSATQTKFFSFSVRSTPAKRSFAPAQPLFPNLSPFPFPLSLKKDPLGIPD